MLSSSTACVSLSTVVSVLSSSTVCVVAALPSFASSLVASSALAVLASSVVSVPPFGVI